MCRVFCFFVFFLLLPPPPQLAQVNGMDLLGRHSIINNVLGFVTFDRVLAVLFKNNSFGFYWAPVDRFEAAHFFASAFFCSSRPPVIDDERRRRRQLPPRRRFPSAAAATRRRIYVVDSSLVSPASPAPRRRLILGGSGLRLPPPPAIAPLCFVCFSVFFFSFLGEEGRVDWEEKHDSVRHGFNRNRTSVHCPATGRLETGTLLRLTHDTRHESTDSFFLFFSIPIPLQCFSSSSYYSDIVQRMPIYSLYHLFLCIVLEFFSSFFTVDLCDSLQSELLIPIRVTKSGSFQCSHSTKELFSKKKETNEKLVLRDRFSVNEILIIKKLPKTSRFLI